MLVDKKRLVAESFKQSPLGSNDFVEEALESIVQAFIQESEIAIKELLKLADIDPDRVDSESVAHYKLKLAEKNISIKQIANPIHAFRLLIQAVYKEEEFVVGFLIYINFELNVIRRIRIDSIEEQMKAFEFLNGGSVYEPNQSDKG